jgi:hydroxymethylglutaryl-CoA synthase
VKLGIDDLSVYVPDRRLPLAGLAAARGIPAAKFHDGLGQEQMAVPPPDEDIVTMAAAAAAPLLERMDTSQLDTLIVGTEGGVDESKASAIYVHRLLGLPPTVKAFEVKQACCGATCGLNMALNLVARYPGRKALVIGSDIARYEPGSPGEPTQGAGAAAMLIASEPRLLDLDTEWGTFTDDVMDFWRPSYRRDAVVDGKYSIKVYLTALAEAWNRYAGLNALRFEDHERFCYHLPFTRMADKAHASLAKLCGVESDSGILPGQIADGLRYNRITGNSYTASLFMSLASLLDTGAENLGGKRIGLFSYGSGCMAAFFSGIVQPAYRQHLRSDAHAAMFASRRAVEYADYLAWQSARLPEDGTSIELPLISSNRYRLAGIRDHQRLYEICDEVRAVA